MQILNYIKIFLITLLFFFVFDLIFGKFIYKKFIRKNFIDTYQQIYLKTNYDHALKKELEVFYGNITYKLCTDKNGFRTFCNNISNKNKNYDIALIGDSFTEGVGLSYENTYAGIFTKKIGIERVANLGVSSYSPSIYYLKLKELIKKNYKFKEVIIFVDQSDLVDELLCYKFTGDKMDALDVFHPNRMAKRILGMGDVISLVERAQQNFDEEEARKLQKKMFENTFGLDDFLSQIQKIKKMGNIKDLLGMMPGMSSKVKDIDVDDESFKPIESIIYSMTPIERKKPDILNGSRKKRIAEGSGTSVQEVNQLIKQFNQMGKMMKMMKKSGPSGMMSALGLDNKQN